MRIAVEEPQDLIWAAKGWEVISFFVCFLYSLKEAVKMVSKFGEEVEADEIWDIVQVEGAWAEA